MELQGEGESLEVILLFGQAKVTQSLFGLTPQGQHGHFTAALLCCEKTLGCPGLEVLGLTSLLPYPCGPTHLPNSSAQILLSSWLGVFVPAYTHPGAPLLSPFRLPQVPLPFLLS